MYVPGLDFLVHGWWRKWVLRGRMASPRALASEPGWVLGPTARYRGSVYAVAAVYSALYTWAFFFAAPFADEPTWKRWALEVGSAVLWLVVLFAAAATLVERVVVTEAFVRRRSWRGFQALAWRELSRVVLQLDEDRVDLESEAGGSVSISLLLDGLPVLLPYLERHWGVDVVQRLRPHLPSS